MLLKIRFLYETAGVRLLIISRASSMARTSGTIVTVLYFVTVLWSLVAVKRRLCCVVESPLVQHQDSCFTYERHRQASQPAYDCYWRFFAVHVSHVQWMPSRDRCSGAFGHEERAGDCCNACRHVAARFGRLAAGAKRIAGGYLR